MAKTKFNQADIQQMKQTIIDSLPLNLPQKLLDEVNVADEVEDIDAVNTLYCVEAGVSEEDAVAVTIHNIVRFLREDGKLPAWYVSSIPLAMQKIMSVCEKIKTFLFGIV